MPTHKENAARLKREMAEYMYRSVSQEDAYRCYKLSDELEREEYLARLEAEPEQASSATATKKPIGRVA